MVLINHVLGLLLQPQQEWQAIRDNSKTVLQCYVELVVLLALIPPFAGFYGATEIGWQMGWEEPVKMTVASALPIALLYYLVILVAIFVVGKAIHWMAATYGARPTLADCIKLSAFTATPLLLVGIVQFYPVLWVNFLAGLPALAYTVYLLYSGVPIIMNISTERGFLFSSAVITFGLVSLVALLAGTVILWSIGLEPMMTR